MLDKQLKKLQIQVHLILHDNLMTHFLGKVPVVFKTKELSNVLEKLNDSFPRENIELPLKWLKYISFIICL